MSVKIENGIVELRLTSPRGGVRICDENGNHIARPVSTAIDFDNHYIEWMITNDELAELINQRLTAEQILELVHQLKKINISLKDSEYYSRSAQKQDINKSVGGFSVYKYEEVFYSFEKRLGENLKAKITFKMGDYTLAAHMFVLIGFNHPDITLENVENNIATNTPVGSNAKCRWTPDKESLMEVAKALAHSSEAHRNDLVQMLG